MTAVLSLEDCRRKVERADQHIENLRLEIERFREREPYLIAREFDADRGENVGRIRIHEAIPERFGLIIGDAAHNLRSALDILLCQLVLAAGGTIERHHNFPIHLTYQKFEKARKKGQIDGVDPIAIARIEALQPYHTSIVAEESPLYVLHCLDIQDKHRLITTVGVRGAGVGLISAVGHIGRMVMGNPNIPLRDGTEMWTLSPDSKVQVETKVFFQVAFDESPPIGIKEVLPTLAQFRKTVVAVVDRFDDLF